MKKHVLAVWLAAFAVGLQAQNPVAYHLRYNESAAGSVSVDVTLPQPMSAPAALVIPRSYPGGYTQVPYDSFVGSISAFAPGGKSLPVVKDLFGPRWKLGQAGDTVQRIEYRVDVGRMEAQIRDAVSTSKARTGYVGLLGYSVFAYIDGMEERKVSLLVDGPEGWPVLSTLGPLVPPARSVTSVTAMSYYALADSEILMGPDLRVDKLGGKIPLVLAVYAEGAVDMPLEGRLAREALDAVQKYFGDTPFPQYTVQLELLRPLPDHDYNFSQEHTDSGTFSLSSSAGVTAQSTTQLLDRTRFNFAHHMAHSWIPKLAYGDGYRPFTWEMTPVIDTIWFNEGFGRYAAIAAIEASLPGTEGATFRARQLTGLRAAVDTAEPFIRRMSLTVLSREASFLYSSDFRTGGNVFSRGAVMAGEMDDRIRSRTEGRKSLRDGLIWLLRWSAEHHKPFRTEDLAGYFAAATGVDVSDILERWMKPLE